MLIMALMLMISDAGFIWYAMLDTMKTGNFVPSVLVFFGFEVSSRLSVNLQINYSCMVVTYYGYDKCAITLLNLPTVYHIDNRSYFMPVPLHPPPG